MKKKIMLILLIIVIIAGYSGYKYIFKGPRDISSETAEYTISAIQLKAEFTSNQKGADAKYNGKAIIVSGKVTEKTKESITLDNDVVCVLSSIAINNISLNMDVKIKGECNGYDDLFEQVKLTECTILNK